MFDFIDKETKQYESYCFGTNGPVIKDKRSEQQKAWEKQEYLAKYDPEIYRLVLEPRSQEEYDAIYNSSLRDYATIDTPWRKVSCPDEEYKRTVKPWHEEDLKQFTETEHKCRAQIQEHLHALAQLGCDLDASCCSPFERNYKYAPEDWFQTERILNWEHASITITFRAQDKSKIEKSLHSFN
jgi:hypothetical protein